MHLRFFPRSKATDRLVLFILTALLVAMPTRAQEAAGREPEDVRVWLSTGFNLRINPSWRLYYTELYGFDPEPGSESEPGSWNLPFIQRSLSVRYALGEHQSLQGGYDAVLTRSGSGERSHYHRFQTAYGQFFRVQRWSLSQSFRYEWFTPERSRYEHRFTHTLRAQYRPRNAPWRLRPYASVQLFYYAGGTPRAYYPDGPDGMVDSSGTNGLHRFRASLGVYCKPHDRFYLTVFAMSQREFNLGQQPVGALNYYDPVRDRIRMPFQHYTVIGTSLKFRLELEQRERRETRSRKQRQTPETDSQQLLPDQEAP